MSLKQRYMAAIGLDILFSLAVVYAFVLAGQAFWGVLIDLTGRPFWIMTKFLKAGVPLVIVGYFAATEIRGGTLGKQITGINSYGVKTGLKMVYHEAVDNMVSHIRIKRV